MMLSMATDETVDWGLADVWAMDPDNYGSNMSLAYLALKAENASLKAAILQDHDIGISAEACCGREISHNAAMRIRKERTQ